MHKPPFVFYSVWFIYLTKCFDSISRLGAMKITLRLSHFFSSVQNNDSSLRAQDSAAGQNKHSQLGPQHTQDIFSWAVFELLWYFCCYTQSTSSSTNVVVECNLCYQSYPPIVKSWSQSFRRSLKFYSKCKCLMTWSIHPGHWMRASTMKFQWASEVLWKKKMIWGWTFTLIKIHVIT